MTRVIEATTDEFELECIQQYECSGDQRTVTIKQDDTANGLWVYVDGEIAGHYTPVELAKELGAW